MSHRAKRLLEDAIATWIPVIVCLAAAWVLVMVYGKEMTEPTPLYIVPGSEIDGYVEYRLLDQAGLDLYCERRVQ